MEDAGPSDERGDFVVRVELAVPSTDSGEKQGAAGMVGKASCSLRVDGVFWTGGARTAGGVLGVSATRDFRRCRPSERTCHGRVEDLAARVSRAEN